MTGDTDDGTSIPAAVSQVRRSRLGASSMAMMGFRPQEALASVRHFKLTGAKVT